MGGQYAGPLGPPPIDDSEEDELDVLLAAHVGPVMVLPANVTV